MIKAIQIGLGALRLLGPFMADAEKVFGKGTGAQKLGYVLRYVKLAFSLGSDLNAIGEKDAAGAIDKIDNVFTPAINEVVAINHEYGLWDGFVKTWSWFTGLLDGGAEEAPPEPEAAPE